MSGDGRVARDTMLGLMKTCRKLGPSFWRHLGDRLRLADKAIPPLATLVVTKAWAPLPSPTIDRPRLPVRGHSVSFPLNNDKGERSLNALTPLAVFQIG